MSKWLLFLLLCGWPLAHSRAEAPAGGTAPSVQLTVAGRTPLRVDEALLAGLPSAEVVESAHDEPPARWAGVALVDVLRKAGVALDRDLRGRQLARYVRVTATDGYQVVFSVGELDAGFGNTRVILADRRDGKPLDGDGPFRLVVPADQRAGRWVRNVSTIEVVDAGTDAAVPGHRAAETPP